MIEDSESREALIRKVRNRAMMAWARAVLAAEHVLEEELKKAGNEYGVVLESNREGATLTEIETRGVTFALAMPYARDRDIPELHSRLVHRLRGAALAGKTNPPRIVEAIKLINEHVPKYHVNKEFFGMRPDVSSYDQVAQSTLDLLVLTLDAYVDPMFRKLKDQREAVEEVLSRYDEDGSSKRQGKISATGILLELARMVGWPLTTQQITTAVRESHKSGN